MAHGDRDEQKPLYRYSFGTVEFDEARGELRVAGVDVDLEQRPMQVLACLLHHADEVVTRQELFDKVWAGRPTVDNVLANAVTKLRKALGDAGACVVNVPRVGYRLRATVTRTVSGRRLLSHLQLTAGQPVPGREHMRLREQLGPSRGSEVWLARHDKTGEPRVYKFSADGDRLAALKREATIYRLLHESLGQRDDFVRVIDWNFEDAPFWLECEYAGHNLRQWADEGAGLVALSLAQRLQLFLRIADAVAAAHGVGVLHKDIKPANILLAGDGGRQQVRIADFGASRLLEPGRLEELGITALGMTMTHNGADSSGTPLYLAPELLSGQAPTVQSDIYALGLILYQLAVGDLRRPLAPGWESDIDDELLREDIAAATDGSPARRLGSVGELCERLRGRAARRVERTRLREVEARVRAAERALERSRARRPWVIAALALLLIGLGASLWQYHLASAARDEAERQAAIATATNRFLNDDLLGAGIGGNSPAWYQRNPRLREILDAAAGHLGQRYRKAPLLAAGLHRTLGRAYRSSGDYAKAAAQLRMAVDLFDRSLGQADERSLLTGYELAVMEARLSQFTKAAARLDRVDALAGARRLPMSELGLRSHLARADLLHLRFKVKDALAHYRAADIRRKVLHPADAPLAAHIALGIADCQLRLQHPAQAERMARVILGGKAYTEDSVGLGVLAQAHTLLGKALGAQGRFAAAIPVFERAADDYGKALGADSQGAISALSSLAYMYSMNGDEEGALRQQQRVYDLAKQRWGAQSQSALIELLNLASNEQDTGDLKQALAHMQEAAAGFLAVSGKNSPLLHSTRVVTANVLNQLGRNREALALINQVDPVAYQATTSNPGRAAVLQAVKAHILLDLGRREDGTALLRTAFDNMKAQGVSAEEIAYYRDASATPAPAK